MEKRKSFGMEGVMGSIFNGAAHVAFNVSDMEKSLDFYKRVFGFEKAFEMKHPETGADWIVYVCMGNGQFLELFYGGKKEVPYADENIGFAHLCIAVSDINAAYEKLVESGAPVDSKVSFGIDGNWQCWTHDPDGNRIELMQMMKDSLQSRFISEH